VFGIEHELELYTIFCFFCRRAAASNNAFEPTALHDIFTSKLAKIPAMRAAQQLPLEKKCQTSLRINITYIESTLQKL
jgi:hypothetical protein